MRARRAAWPPALAVAVMLAGGLARNEVLRCRGPWRSYQPPAEVVPVPDARRLLIAAAQAVPERLVSVGGARPPATAMERQRALAGCAPALALLYQAFGCRCRLNPRTDGGGRCDGQLLRVLRIAADQAWAEGRWPAVVDAAVDRVQLANQARTFDLSSVGPSANLGYCGVAEAVGHLTAAQARGSLARVAAVLRRQPTFAEGLRSATARALDETARELGRRRLTWAHYRYGATDDGQPAVRARALDWLGLLRWQFWRDTVANSEAVTDWALQPYGTPLKLPAEDVWPAAGMRGARRLYAHHQASERLFLTALAVGVWTAEHGAPPGTLAQLCPSVLAAVPRDPFDGRPLRYRLVEGRPRLWSVGPDLHDDGGVAAQPPPTSRATTRRVSVGGDRVPVGDLVWGDAGCAGGPWEAAR